MATNSVATGGFPLADVVTAVTTMRTGTNDTKKTAHEFLEKFQKSVRETILWKGSVKAYR